LSAVRWAIACACAAAHCARLTARAARAQPDSDYTKVSPLCVLDFYVHESCQRSGEGRQLYDAMLRSEGVVPASLGYDRPSTKLLAFLRKHARLASYTAQGNNYVLFDEFWRQGGGGAARRGGGAPQQYHSQQQQQQAAAAQQLYQQQQAQAQQLQQLYQQQQQQQYQPQQYQEQQQQQQQTPSPPRPAMGASAPPANGALGATSAWRFRNDVAAHREHERERLRAQWLAQQTQAQHEHHQQKQAAQQAAAQQAQYGHAAAARPHWMSHPAPAQHTAPPNGHAIANSYAHANGVHDARAAGAAAGAAYGYGCRPAIAARERLEQEQMRRIVRRPF